MGLWLQTRKKIVKTKTVRAWKMTKKKIFFFVTFKKPEKPWLLWYARILWKLVFASCVCSRSKRLHGFSVVSCVKCIGWACGVSVSSGQWFLWYCTATGSGSAGTWAFGWLGPLWGDHRERGRGAYPRFLKLFAETFKRHLAKAPGSTVFLYSLTFVFRYWYLFV